MAERELTSAGQLRAEFHTQTAKISWQDLQTHYARGAVVMVARELNLVDVATEHYPHHCLMILIQSPARGSPEG